MATHSSLTGADLHEPKGVAGASAGTVYVADGLGSGSWTSVSGSDTVLLSAVLPDVSTASSVLIPIGYSCSVVGIDFILGGNITGADSTVTVARSDGASMGGVTVAYISSAEGTTFPFTPSGNASLTYSTHRYIKITTNGGSTGTIPLYIGVRITRT